MNTLPIDTIVNVKGYGIGIIVDVFYSSELYSVSFQGKKHLINFNDVIPKEKEENYDKRNTIKSGDFVSNRIYGHGVVIRKIGEGDLLDCKFGKLRVCIKSEYLTKEKYSQSNFPQRTSTKQTEKPIVKYKGISHNYTTKNSTLTNSNTTGSFRHSKYALTGNASNPLNRQDTSVCVSKLSDKSTISKPSKKKLIVKFPDGTIISNDDAVETYIDALWEFNPDSIMLNHISFNGISIITSKNAKGGRVQVGVNQWAYIPTSVEEKKNLLVSICKQLNINCEILILIEDTEKAICGNQKVINEIPSYKGIKEVTKNNNENLFTQKTVNKNKWFGVKNEAAAESLYKYGICARIKDEELNEYDCFIPVEHFEDIKNVYRIDLDEEKIDTIVRNDSNIVSFLSNIHMSLSEFMLLPITDKLFHLCNYYDDDFWDFFDLEGNIEWIINDILLSRIRMYKI